MCMRKPQGRGLEVVRKCIASCLSELASMRESSRFLVSDAYGSSQVDVEDRITTFGGQPVGFDAN
jgi:hypothetical protein